MNRVVFGHSFWELRISTFFIFFTFIMFTIFTMFVVLMMHYFPASPQPHQAPGRFLPHHQKARQAASSWLPALLPDMRSPLSWELSFTWLRPEKQILSCERSYNMHWNGHTGDLSQLLLPQFEFSPYPAVLTRAFVGLHCTAEQGNGAG